ncbi:MAG: DUF1501 domain-containing protein [Verrucomicrobia bacterium]|nr:DUF1501 domain-containing protein [Verrucomicrobiota bacterium]
MSPLNDYLAHHTRRQFFRSAGLSAGAIALATMESPLAAATKKNGIARVHPALAGLPHIAPKARRLIYLHMNGGPSQIDMWDYKPKLEANFDKDLPDSIRMGQRITTMTSGQARLPVAPSMFKFAQHGQCGTWVSELLPWTAKVADDLAVLRSIHTEAINHDPACTFVMTGSEVPGRASLGSWLSYGLGSENNDLPSFVVLTPSWSSGAAAQALFTRMWNSGFLPTRHNGVALRSGGDPVLFVQNPPGVEPANRRALLDGLGKLNQLNHDRYNDPETLTRIAQYEMAFRMQTSVPELVDLSKEPKPILERYGPEVTKPGTFAHAALLARRLAERDVRVVQVLHRGWDQHGNLPKDIKSQCNDSDQPCYALLTDLKERGLLKDTLVVWGGEFGRTVYSQGTLKKDQYGRDHHPRNFCMWMAGGGVKGGVVYGETDDFSYNIVENPVHLRDLNGTILHLMGVDHRRLTFKFQGLDHRLTGVEHEAQIVKPVLA